MRFTGEQMADMRRAVGVAADADGATIVAALGQRLEELANPSALAPPVAPPALSATAEGEGDIVAWGLSTGRYAPPRAEFWARRADEERRRTGAAAQTAAEIRSLSPVYEACTSSTPAVADEEFPLTRALDRAMFGPTPEEREREEAIAAEASLAEQIERERAAAAELALTEDERRAIFGPDSQG